MTGSCAGIEMRGHPRSRGLFPSLLDFTSPTVILTGKGCRLFPQQSFVAGNVFMAGNHVGVRLYLPRQFVVFFVFRERYFLAVAQQPDRKLQRGFFGAKDDREVDLARYLEVVALLGHLAQYVAVFVVGEGRLVAGHELCVCAGVAASLPRYGATRQGNLAGSFSRSR